MTHNKKRNTAFLFEALVKEQIECVLKKNDKKAKLIEATINKFFSPNSILGKELELYVVLSESSKLTDDLAERLISSVKKEHEKLDNEQIFVEQSKLIHYVNKTFGDKVYENYISNYKILATINNLFNLKVPIKQRVIMEQKLKEWMTSKVLEEEQVSDKIDVVVFQQYIKNFNEKYSTLLDEQKKLLSNYILYQFGSELDFKLYVNEECSRLIKTISSNINKLNNQPELQKTVNECLSNLKNVSFKHVDESFVYSLMKYQELAREIENG